MDDGVGAVRLADLQLTAAEVHRVWNPRSSHSGHVAAPSDGGRALACDL